MFAAKLSIRACKQTAESVSVMFCLSFAPASYSNNSKLLMHAIVYFVLTYSARAPFAYLRPVKTLFYFFKNRAASLPKLCLTSASPLSLCCSGQKPLKF
jgi:hypothetical protein